jgi:UDP-glucose 4-epimerase
MKILVTGGAGFIGSNVVDGYIAAGHNVTVVDNLYTGKRENLNPKARFHLMDIRSPRLTELFARERFDVVNHHAAQMSVPASVADPLFDADVNVRGFVNVLEAARTTGVRKVVFISSGGAIYGEATEYPTPETTSPVPLSPYAITKTVSEQYLYFYRHQYGLDYTVLRYANVYGPRQVPHGEAGVVAIFMDRLLAGQPCTVYHFSDEPLGMARDYCYVGDVVRANLLALENGSGEAVNIGTGKPTRTRELFDAVFTAIKVARPEIASELAVPFSGPARPGDLSRSCLEVSKAERVLAFAAACSLGKGLTATLAWRLAKADV